MFYPNLSAQSKNIGIFGGSFNPLHKGHLEMLSIIKKRKLVCEVIVLPNYRNPIESKNYYLSVATRLSLLKQVLAVDKAYHLWTYECEQKKAVTSIESLSLLQKQFPLQEFYWVLGADSLATISQWKNSQDFQKMVNFIIFSRKNVLLDVCHLHTKKKIIILEDRISDIESSLLRNNQKISHKYVQELKSYFQQLFK